MSQSHPQGYLEHYLGQQARHPQPGIGGSCTSLCEFLNILSSLALCYFIRLVHSLFFRLQSLNSLTALCTRTGALAHLTSITLTIGPHIPVQAFADDALALLTPCPLERVHIYSTGKVIGLNDSRFSIEEGDEEATMDALSNRLSTLSVSGANQSLTPPVPNAIPTTSTTSSSTQNVQAARNASSSTAGASPHSGPTDSFCMRLVALHSHRLTRFAVYKMVLSLQAIDAICAGCPKLEQLFVVVERGDMVSVSPSSLISLTAPHERNH